jgi:predicted NAD/FAD-binding protein
VNVPLHYLESFGTGAKFYFIEEALPMRIAIIGGGISGMVSAFLLNEDHDVVVYEANDYIGGHTHTIDIMAGSAGYAVDTGFIVFNEITYPNFLKLLRRIGVKYQNSKMTFSVKSERDRVEYGAHNLNTLFAQRKNLLDPSFYRMIRDIFRFRREFNRLLEQETQSKSLVSYLTSHGYSRRFIDYFIIPLGSSLWSTDPERIHDFPLATFVRFFDNHGFLRIKNPFEWKVIKGGSARYVEKLTHPFRNKIRLSTPVQAVSRYSDSVAIHSADGITEKFDHVVLAVHSDQALALLSDPVPAEREILGAIPYQENLTMLHTDTRILPQRKRIWSSWNYCIPKDKQGRPVITYDMNILQSLSAREEYCVTLNRPESIAPDKIIGTYSYHHPVYTTVAPAAQRRHSEISGIRRTHYAGAYWGYGFHEDGVNGALAACSYFGKSL